MRAFEYEAIDEAGRQRKGVVSGEDRRQAGRLLRAQGLTPTAMNEVVEKGARPLSRRRMTARELALFSRQLATMLESGSELADALSAIADQEEGKRVQGIVLALRAAIMEGQGLSEAMATFPASFPEIYVATIAAGEAAGALTAVLTKLAGYVEFQQQLRQKIVLALIYPLLLTVVATLVVGGLLTYVVPQVTGVFANMGRDLPLLTRMLILVSSFLRDHGGGLAVLSGGLATLFFSLATRPKGRRLWQKVLLRLPLAGHLYRLTNTARFTRSLGILVKSGIPLVNALDVAARTISCLPMRGSVDRARSLVREGSSLHHALAKSGYFPAVTLHLIASGEAGGRLASMLETAADTHDNELQAAITAVMAILEPLLILVMGGVIMLIVLGILMPIFDLNQMIQ